MEEENTKKRKAKANKPDWTAVNFEAMACTLL